jgi:hypothetical protein
MEAQESLAIIEQMISNSKKNFKRSSKYFLLWGWAVLLSAIAQYILLKLLYPYTYYVWLTMPVCIVITILLKIRDNKNQKVKTYTSHAMSSLWMAMGIAFILLTYFGIQYNVNINPVFLILYGVGIFTSGRMLEFKPLIYGGLFAFIMSFVIMHVEGTDILLVFAIAVLGSYIIPGHLLLKADTNE